MLCSPEIDHQANFLDCITGWSKEVGFRPSVSEGSFSVSRFCLIGRPSWTRSEQVGIVKFCCGVRSREGVTPKNGWSGLRWLRLHRQLDREQLTESGPSSPG